jgi:hypothetical protein
MDCHPGGPVSRSSQLLPFRPPRPPDPGRRFALRQLYAESASEVNHSSENQSDDDGRSRWRVTRLRARRMARRFRGPAASPMHHRDRKIQGSWPPPPRHGRPVMAEVRRHGKQVPARDPVAHRNSCHEQDDGDRRDTPPQERREGSGGGSDLDGVAIEVSARLVPSKQPPGGRRALPSTAAPPRAAQARVGRRLSAVADEVRQSARRRQSAAAARHCGNLARPDRARSGTNPATSWPGRVATASEREAATARMWLLEACGSHGRAGSRWPTQTCPSLSHGHLVGDYRAPVQRGQQHPRLPGGRDALSRLCMARAVPPACPAARSSEGRRRPHGTARASLVFATSAHQCLLPICKRSALTSDRRRARRGSWPMEAAVRGQPPQVPASPLKEPRRFRPELADPPPPSKQRRGASPPRAGLRDATNAIAWATTPRRSHSS